MNYDNVFWMVFLFLRCYVADLGICILDDDYMFGLMKDIKALSLF